MSAPDFIWAMPDAQDLEWGSCSWDVSGPLAGSYEYVRRAPAVLAELPEVRALVAAALQRALAACEGMDPAGDILALIDTDHAAALDAVKAQAREEERALLIDCAASLAAAVSLLERGGKKAAPSDKMFFQMLNDYRRSLTRVRAAIRAGKVQP